MKKIISVLLVAVMILSLASCGKKDAGNNSTDGKNTEVTENAVTSALHYFEPEYFDNLPKELTNSNLQKFIKDGVYYIGTDENYTKTGIYRYSLTDKKAETFVEVDTTEKVDPTEETESINHYAVNDNMLVYLYYTNQTDPSINDTDFSNSTEADVYNYMTNNWGYDTSTIESELNGDTYKAYKNEDGSIDYPALYKKLVSYEYNSIQKYYIAAMDLNGKELFRNEIHYFDTDPVNNTNGYPIALEVDDKDNIYLVYNYYSDQFDEYCIKILDKSGNEKAEYKQNQYIENIYALKNGKVAISQYNDKGGTDLVELNPDTATLSDKPFFSVPVNCYNLQQLDDTNMLSMDTYGLRLMENGKSESELYLKWMDSNILSGSIYSYGILDDGRIAVYLNHYTNGKAVTEIVLLSETDKEKLLNKTQIKIATLYMDSYLEESVVDFNKKNNEYHIDVISFNYEGDDYDNYNTYIDNFMLSLASDNSIDMLALNNDTAYNHIVNFAQKGLLVDLLPFLEKDENLKKEDLAENLINPLYYDKKLVAIPATISMNTLIGKKSDVGDKMGWNPDKAKELLASKGDDAVFMLYTTREEMLENCISLSYSDFVNVEKGTCDFDNDAFVSALEFSNLLPESINYDDDSYGANQPERISKGKILVANNMVSDFDTLQQYKTIWNDDVTYIGYPSSSDNNGALIRYNDLYGITKNCENPDIAWSIISGLIKNPKSKEDYYEMNGGYSYSIYPTKNSVDAFLGVLNDVYAEDGYSTFWDDYEITLKPLTDDMMQKYKDVVFGATAVYGCVPKGVMDIIKEEASSYYSGQKTAEEVAAIVQSRVKIYLSETR